MASEETLALAEHYLQKHYTPDSVVGLGPFLETGDYALFAHPRARVDGGMLFSILSNGYVDCRIVAQRMYLDILAEHPELDPRIIMYNGGVQNFVEITYPATGEKIQIDSTPWYNCLNPGLSGEDTTSEAHSIDFLNISKTKAPIFSVKRTEDSVTTISILGFLPQVSMEEKLADIERLKEGIDEGIVLGKRPEYRFIFQVETRPVDWPAGKPSPRFTKYYIDVLNSELLQSALTSGIVSARNLDFLIQSRVIRVGVMLSDDVPSMNMPMPSISFMKELTEKMKEGDLFAEFERNIPRILKLLALARPMLRVFEQDKKVDVKRGLVTRSLSSLFGVKTPFDDGKYGDIIKLFGDKKPPKIDLAKFDLSGIKLKRIRTG